MLVERPCLAKRYFCHGSPEFTVLSVDNQDYVSHTQNSTLAFSEYNQQDATFRNLFIYFSKKLYIF